MTALAKIELSSAVPIEPPTCCIVLTIAEATPVSARSTPNVAVWKAGGKMLPMPMPIRISAGSTSRRSSESVPSCVEVEHRGRAEQHADDHVRARAELRQQALAHDVRGER